MRLMGFWCSAFVFAATVQAQFVLISPSGSGGRTSSVSRPPALLHDGNVLIVNGWGSSELYDARTRTFAAAGMPPVRIDYGGFAIVGLPDGGAAVTGGTNPESGLPTNYVLLWDRRTAQFRQTTGMLAARAGHAMVAVNSDTLLIVGGSSPTWETYDVRNEAPIASGPLPAEVSVGRMAFVHPSGKLVFLSGGRSLIFDPATLTFSVAFGIPPSASGSAVEMLTDGRFLVTGGTKEAPPTLAAVAEAFIFDAFTGEREEVEPMLNSRFWHAATRLPSGKILITGGVGYCLGWCKPVVAPAEIFDPLTKTFSSAGVMNSLRYNHAPIRLNTGEVLVVGGDSGSDLPPDPELYITERGGSGKRRAVSH